MATRIVRRAFIFESNIDGRTLERNPFPTRRSCEKTAEATNQHANLHRGASDPKTRAAAKSELRGNQISGRILKELSGSVQRIAIRT
jgi:hypothetical protein